MERIRRYVLAGLVVVVPVSLTIYVLIIIFKFVDSILGRFINVYLKESLGFYIPGLGFFISVILVFLIGFLASRFIGRKIVTRLENWFSNLPLISKIYPALKQITLFMAAQKEFGFKKVVLVEYPSKGIWSLGFLTNEQFEKINKLTGKEMVSVFIPSTPGPLTGYLIFIERREIKLLDLPVSEALRIIISGGVFKPYMINKS